MTTKEMAESSDLMLIITNKCNHYCKFCFVRIENEIKKIDLSLERIEEILISKKDSINDIYIMGGEPTLYYKFKELIQLIYDMGFGNISIESNGNYLNDREMVSFLLERNVKNFILAFHDIDETDLEFQTGNKTAFSRANKAIDNIIALGGKITINNVINSYNYKRLYDIYKYLFNKGVTNIVISHVIPPVHINYIFDELIPGFSELYPHLEKALDYLKDNNVTFVLQYFPYCVLKKYKENRQNSFMSKFYCVNVNGHGYYHHTDCSDPVSIKRSECGSCIYNDKCMGVFKDYIEQKGWSEFEPVLTEN